MINYCKKDDGYSVFHICCQGGHLDCIKFLLTYNESKQATTKIETNTKTKSNQMNPLLLACNFNYSECAQYLIDNNIPMEINDANAKGKTAMSFCAFFGDIKTARKIFQRFGDKVDVNKSDIDGCTPLWMGML